MLACFHLLVGQSRLLKVLAASATSCRRVAASGRESFWIPTLDGSLL